jgi:hypothetical protein
VGFNVIPAVIIISVESTADTLIIIEVTHYFNDDMELMYVNGEIYMQTCVWM